MMNLAIVNSRAQDGVLSPPVAVEVHLANGLPSFSIVGLAETAVKESRDRVRGALINSHFEFPSRRITVNLAPADLPKEGSRFDLAIALGVLAASGQVPENALETYEFIGELALGGGLRPVRGSLPAVLRATEAGRKVILPAGNVAEAALVSDAFLVGAQCLLDVVAHLRGETLLPTIHGTNTPQARTDYADLRDVSGQQHAKRALEIAAAGGHNLLLIGPPGTGKSMLAHRLPGILPPMTEAEAIETAAVYSISHGGFDVSHWRERPFRAPHHTASAAALVGGGSPPRPGEVTLAHHGVLFLDELPEYARRVLEVLREPLESGNIIISRAARQSEFPAAFQLVAAMNPCPCGYCGDGSDRCVCTPEQIRRYRARVSGPLLDRIDIHIEVPRAAQATLVEQPRNDGESSQHIRTRVVAARLRQLERQGVANAALGVAQISKTCLLGMNERRLLEIAMEKLNLSARAYHRILKVARTIADLDEREKINASHLSEAISYRRIDRGYKEF